MLSKVTRISVSASSGAKAALIAILLLALTVTGCGPKEPEIILATTTSTYDSGLLDELIPLFEEVSDYVVKPIAVGTGKALALARQGEADILLAHAPAAEAELAEQGYVIERRLIMHNDFVIVGPPDDPANLRGMTSASGALQQVVREKALFVSRGDDSGTHKREMRLWATAGADPEGTWYLETGTGMGQTLQVASEKGAYTLTDRGTYLALQSSLALNILVEGDSAMLNLYHVMIVNPQRFDKVNTAGARLFSDFLLSPEAQEIIRNFGSDKYHQPLFIPDAGRTEDDLTG